MAATDAYQLSAGVHARRPFSHVTLSHFPVATGSLRRVVAAHLPT